MRYLGVDYGLKRTGLAVCDADETLASPLNVLTGQERLVDQIAEAVRQQGADGIVIGLPLNMDGTEGKQSARVRAFAAEVGRRTNLPISFCDERLSSFGAKEKISGLGITRKKKKKHLDAIAAADILQTFIDERNGR
ncbi:MAG: Holliday junction resolvase RuvX [Phycisphaerae bacterium]|nr:Holliday junction resolvase RuvX [Phycisphaerae bacterium]